MVFEKNVSGETAIGISKATLAFIQQSPTVQKWISGIPTERTRNWYAYNLMRFLDGIHETPDHFLTEIEKNPKQTSITTKAFLGGMKSRAVARVMLSAVKSFTAFYETPISLNGLKIRVARTRRKPELTWENAERIIANAKEPYKSAFRFLKWSGLGLDEFEEIQGSPEIRATIEKQRGDTSKPYIRIDLRPRKNNVDDYYALVPKEYVPKFPLTTYEFRVKEGPRKGELMRGGQVVDHLDMQMNWQRACERAGLRQIGMGPHTMRSCFDSQCAKLGVKEAVADFQMGHGAPDAYGYRREILDEAYVAVELSKLWKGSKPVTKTDLAERDGMITELTGDLADMTNDMDQLRREKEELDERVKRLEQMVTANRSGTF